MIIICSKTTFFPVVHIGTVKPFRYFLLKYNLEYLLNQKFHRTLKRKYFGFAFLLLVWWNGRELLSYFSSTKLFLYLTLNLFTFSWPVYSLKELVLSLDFVYEDSFVYVDIMLFTVDYCESFIKYLKPKRSLWLLRTNHSC